MSLTTVGVVLWLQNGAGGLFGGGAGGAFQFALPILLIVTFYFLMIAPNQRKQKAWQEMLTKLKTGDKVVTNGGIRGTIVTVKDDGIILRLPPDGIKMEFVKSAIASVTTADEA